MQSSASQNAFWAKLQCGVLYQEGVAVQVNIRMAVLSRHSCQWFFSWERAIAMFWGSSISSNMEQFACPQLLARSGLSAVL